MTTTGFKLLLGLAIAGWCLCAAAADHKQERSLRSGLRKLHGTPDASAFKVVGVGGRCSGAIAVKMIPLEMAAVAQYLSGK